MLENRAATGSPAASAAIWVPRRNALDTTASGRTSRIALVVSVEGKRERGGCSRFP